MSQPLRSSPALLVVAILAVVAGAAAGLLGVGSPGSPPLSVGGNYHAVLPTTVVELVLASPLIALGGILALSLAGIGGDGVSIRPTVLVFCIVGIFLLAIVLLIHPQAPTASTTLGGLGGLGGTGTGSGSGGSGGAGHGGTTGGSGTGGGAGGNNSTGIGSSNNSTQGGGTGGGTTGSNNSTQGGSGGTTGGGSGGSSNRTNVTTPTLVRPSPPTLPQWMTFVAAAIAVAVVAAMLVPRLAARSRSAPVAPPPSSADPRNAVASVLAEAAARLNQESDPRTTIGRLYRDLLYHLEPLKNGSVHRTPEEVRDLHLLPLGVRPAAAEHLTRLFEEASYSSHPLGDEDVSRAREALGMAETDLRAAGSAA